MITGYEAKIKAVQTQIIQTRKLIDNLSLIRIALFLSEIFFFVLLLNSADNIWRTFIQILLLIPVFIFVYVVRKQSMLDKEIEYQKQLLWVYQNEFNILNSGINGYDSGTQYESETHPYTSDLDIFGKSSLFALLNRCSTKIGNHTLAQKLSVKNRPDEILQRQEAIQEVKEKIESTFSFRANLHGHDVNKIEEIKTQLKNKLGEQLNFVHKRGINIYVALVPYISGLLILAAIFLGSIFWKLFVLLLIVHTGVNVILGAKVNLVFYSFGGSANLLNSYASAILWTENQQWKSHYISKLLNLKTPVSQEIRSLSKVIQRFDARLNLIVGGVLNGLFLWDLRCCISLQKWHQSSSGDVIDALNHLGEFEELISFATTAYNHPDWSFPEITNQFALEAENIGHPLIPENLRVDNNFAVDAHSTVDIITGSNMAGKSTFLRTLGINMVLAYSGAPVCAAKMKLYVFSIVTYMRIKDSLNESTSTFKAELNRLKMILENVVTDNDTFVLIDEMLRGTNSRDKYLGSKVFVEKLMEQKTPALFATHDLQLADLKEKHHPDLRNFHFDISFTNGEMKFDYKLKHGPCTTFNAAILLKQIGLSLD
ncbi:DNA mismatch repair protein MutS [Pedobacter sp. BMA]|nr:DNA mismatch repair protein MutS [Pedobacter sp. BMA]